MVQGMSCEAEELPDRVDVRQNVANLGLFVMKQTLSVTADPKPEHLNSLININRQLAAGLRGQPA